MRDPKMDHLITPENSALIVIDYQPTQINSINSMSRAELVRNIELVARLAVGYDIPVVLSTVNVSDGRNSDTIPSLKQIFGDIPTYDRTSINAWEDRDFRDAVNSTSRQKLIMTALWTEACLTFPTIDAMRENYEVYPVVDAVGGTSVLAHDMALRRVENAGAVPITIAQLTCELQRDWNRSDTVPVMVDILTEEGVFLKLGSGQ